MWDLCESGQCDLYSKDTWATNLYFLYFITSTTSHGVTNISGKPFHPAKWIIQFSTGGWTSYDLTDVNLNHGNLHLTVKLDTFGRHKMALEEKLVPVFLTLTIIADIISLCARNWVEGYYGDVIVVQLSPWYLCEISCLNCPHKKPHKICFFMQDWASSGFGKWLI